MTDGRGLIDTNVVIRLLDLDPASLPEEPVISVITLAELSVGPLITDDLRERSTRQARLQQTEATFEPIPFDANAARAFARVAADMRSVGRKTSARQFDALIAATALAHDLPLYTANPDDFAGIDGLDVREVVPATERPA